MGVKITMATLLVLFFVMVHASAIPSWRFCGYFCSANYNPVCGKLPNGELKRFPNKCEQRRAICRGLADHTDERGCGLEFEDAQYYPGLSVSA